jgi:antibiotic biosynthesis monooxygenase (ABM) superfamily enzyme
MVDQAGNSKETTTAVCVARASAAIVQRVPPEAVNWFNEWQRGVTATAQAFPGYEGTDLFPPTDNRSDEWITVIHFDDDESLQRWLDSTERAEWVEKLRATVGNFELKMLHGGFSQWFAGLTDAADEGPPAWKMALTVLLALYPTVMLLAIFVAPYTSRLGLSVSMLICNALSVSLLQWVVVPTLRVWLGPWLTANSDKAKRASIVGLCCIVALLVALAVVFRLVTG